MAWCEGLRLAYSNAAHNQGACFSQLEKEEHREERGPTSEEEAPSIAPRERSFRGQMNSTTQQSCWRISIGLAPANRWRRTCTLWPSLSISIMDRDTFVSLGFSLIQWRAICLSAIGPFRLTPHTRHAWSYQWCPTGERLRQWACSFACHAKQIDRC